jgi:hypothetical protein
VFIEANMDSNPITDFEIVDAGGDDEPAFINLIFDEPPGVGYFTGGDD